MKSIMMKLRSLFRRRNRQPLPKGLDRRTAGLVSLMEYLAERDLICIATEERRVAITSTLASLFMTDARRWRNFLSNVQLWFTFEVSRNAWNRVFVEAELKAVREATKDGRVLSVVERANIRERARMAVDIDAVPVPHIAPYSFVIIDDNVTDIDEVKPVVVGTYSNGEFNMFNPDGTPIVAEPTA